MIRRSISSLLQTIRPDKLQTAFAATSLLLGLAFVLVASAFVRTGEHLSLIPSHADRIYQISKWIDKPGDERLPSTRTSGLLAPALQGKMPEAEAIARFMNWPEAVELNRGDREVSARQWAFADPGFVRIFEPEFIQGDPQTALLQPGRVVLTETMAKQLFGSTDAVGKCFTGLGGQEYTVSGVIRNLPKASLVQFDILASWASTLEGSGLHQFRFMNNPTGQTVETYVLLHQAEQATYASKRLSEVLRRELAGQPGQYDYYLKPVSGQSSKSGDLGQVESPHSGGKMSGMVAGLFLLGR